MNTLALLNVLATLAGQAAPIVALLQSSAQRGVPPTDEEVAALFAGDDTMAVTFQRHIDQAKAAEAAAGGADPVGG